MERLYNLCLTKFKQSKTRTTFKVLLFYWILDSFKNKTEQFTLEKYWQLIVLIHGSWSCNITFEIFYCTTHSVVYCYVFIISCNGESTFLGSLLFSPQIIFNYFSQIPRAFKIQKGINEKNLCLIEKRNFIVYYTVWSINLIAAKINLCIKLG